MTMFEQPLEDAVLLEWETTPSLREQNFYGLKEQLIRAANLNPRELKVLVPSSGYLVVGNIEENPDFDSRLENLRTAKAMNLITESAIPLFVYDLFRQGYIGAGFYIVRFNTDELPMKGSAL